MYEFTWDDNKCASNIRKHKISFEEARDVFYDPYAMYMTDDDHSDEEERLLVLGLSNKLRVLMVCYCYRDSNSIIRIISARKATKREQNIYGGKL